MEIGLKEKTKDAKKSIMAALRERFSKRIVSENNKLAREKKFADSLEEGEDPIQKLRETHLERVNNNDLVKVKIDRQTTLYVAKEKCKQLPDGTWVKKQSDNV